MIVFLVIALSLGLGAQMAATARESMLVSGPSERRAVRSAFMLGLLIMASGPLGVLAYHLG